MTWLWSHSSNQPKGLISNSIRLTVKIFFVLVMLVIAIQVFQSQVVRWPKREQAPLMNMYDNAVNMTESNKPLRGVAQADGRVRHMTAAGEERFVTKAVSESLRLYTEQVGDLVFLPIDNHDAWVYSAYYDTQPENISVALVRVFGIARYTRELVFCHFLNDERKVISGHGQRRFIKDAHHKKYIAAFFDCPMGPLVSPKFVSVTYNKTDEPRHWVMIHYPKPLTRNFTVCYAALFDYDRTSQLIQSIEINRVLGAQHFYVYNYSISPTTDAALRHYQKLGLLTVLQWSLPTLEVWYYAQNLAINDCVYRNRIVSQFVVIQDTDEFIIPKQHDSWAELLHAVQSEFYQRPNITANIPLASFSVETSFFHGMPSAKSWKDLMVNFSITTEEEKFLTDYLVIPFLFVQRKNYIYKYNSRVKTIVRPEHVYNSGIHYTHSHRGPATHTVVGNDLALVHHYKENGVHIVLDAAVLRFHASVVPALMAKFKELSNLLL